MMFMPKLRDGFDLFDDVLRTPMFSMEPAMKTDIHEKDGRYIMETDLPGFAKEDIQVSLHEGNLTIRAEHNDSKDEKDDKGNIIRKERYSGSYCRSFYVGDSVKEDEIHASYKDGTLTLDFPKVDDKKEIEENKYIAIE